MPKMLDEYQNQLHINLVAYTRNISQIMMALKREFSSLSQTEVWRQVVPGWGSNSHLPGPWTPSTLQLLRPKRPLRLHLCLGSRRKGRKRAPLPFSGSGWQPCTAHLLNLMDWASDALTAELPGARGGRLPEPGLFVGSFSKADKEQGNC